MKRIWRYIIAIALGLGIIVASLLIINTTSQHTRDYTKDVQGFAFLNPNFSADSWNPDETVEENVQVTEFKPFNLRTFFTVATSLLLFVIIVSLFTLGRYGFGKTAIVLLLCLGTLMYLASIGGFLLYGSKKIQGREVVLSSVTAKQKFCRSMKFDIDTYLSGNLNEPQRMCWDFGNKTVDELMGR